MKNTTWTDKALTMNWKDFVAAYVAHKTARKACAGYQVKRAGSAWELHFNGISAFAPMDAGTLYGWLERTPLMPLSREADEVRRVAHESRAAS